MSELTADSNVDNSRPSSHNWRGVLGPHAACLARQDHCDTPRLQFQAFLRAGMVSEAAERQTQHHPDLPSVFLISVDDQIGRTLETLSRRRRGMEGCGVGL